MQVSQEDRITAPEQRRSTNSLVIAAVVILLIIIGGVYYLVSSDDKSAEPVEPTPVQLPEIVPEEPLPTVAPLPEPEIVEPEVIEPVPLTLPEVVEPAEEPLPNLNDSDEFVHQKTAEVADGMKIEPLLVEKDLVRHFVVFVDNLAQGELARKVSPLQAPNRIFTVSEITNKTYLNPDSYHRYDLYADFLAGMNQEQLASAYQQMTPLLGEAFAELGYGDMAFDDRMVEAIDVMLAAPIIEQPIELDGVSVNYQFMDPKPEALPNAQKLMIRMGPDNSRKVKAALRKIKQQLQ
ncbi:DUF3014 domain-containing protein [Shewanella waksmanii]|uniref:DUF3014 domain-containing protein n=1 Tax=Shewanella waksmanii TaxID=213783 RepID=UPI0004904957|nr:DUF3014 domain-containing protein [Shewanella waksmanii]